MVIHPLRQLVQFNRGCAQSVRPIPSHLRNHLIVDVLHHISQVGLQMRGSVAHLLLTESRKCPETCTNATCIALLASGYIPEQRQLPLLDDAFYLLSHKAQSMTTRSYTELIWLSSSILLSQSLSPDSVRHYLCSQFSSPLCDSQTLKANPHP
jgi:hypothetical protein